MSVRTGRRAVPDSPTLRRGGAVEERRRSARRRSAPPRRTVPAAPGAIPLARTAPADRRGRSPGRASVGSLITVAEKRQSVSRRSAWSALRVALADWRRHAGALALVVLAFGVAAVVRAPEVQYGAYLFVFSVWMGWFVLTAVEWIDHADF